MNNKLFLANVLRFFAVIVMQVLVFKRMSLLDANIFIYPIFIMLMPVELPAAIVIFVSFIFGLAIDTFYDTPGIHAGTCVLIGYLRFYILGFMEPKGGYPPKSGPTMSKLGTIWSLKYGAIFMIIHIFTYFSIDEFTFVNILPILYKTSISFLFSMIFIAIYQFLLNPSE